MGRSRDFNGGVAKCGMGGIGCAVHVFRNPKDQLLNYSTCMCSAVEGGYEKEQAEWYR
jgi:hypothetical protein